MAASQTQVGGVAVPGTPALSKWYGIVGALHIQATPKWAFAPRVEWFKDRDGFSTGLAQDLKELTLTGEYKMVEGLLTRLEYRRDWSNQPFFFRGSAVNGTTGFGTYKNQDRIVVGSSGILWAQAVTGATA